MYECIHGVWRNVCGVADRDRRVWRPSQNISVFDLVCDVHLNPMKHRESTETGSEFDFT